MATHPTSYSWGAQHASYTLPILEIRVREGQWDRQNEHGVPATYQEGN